MTPGGLANDNRLPRKEADLFKSIVKFYETKQYKKGLKAADGILRKFPNHGETLAMRGLVLNCLDRKIEAYDYVKRGLKNDMRSHVCWHVYGLLHRSDRRYGDAIKSYKQALKIDQDNVQILRDLSLLQVQMRDCKGFLQTREQLLRLKSTQKLNWISFAVANHLCDSRSTAIKVIDAYTETIKDDDDAPTYEDSELALYRNSILEEQGDFTGALEDLDKCKAKILDKTAWRERRATLLLYVSDDDQKRHRKLSLSEPLRSALSRTSLGLSTSEDPPDEDDIDPAVAAWAELLTWSPPSSENYTYHRGFQCAVLGDLLSAERRRDIIRTQTACETPVDVTILDSASRQRMDTAYAALTAAMPRSEACKWIPLTYATDDFVNLLDDTVRRLVKKGAPALGSALERFFDPRSTHVIDGRPRGAQCCRIVLDLIDRHVTSLRDTGVFAPKQQPEDEKDPPNGDSETEPPLTLFWALYLRTHCLEWLGELEAALETIDECAALMPTAVEVYEKRGRLLKKSGDVDAAAVAMDEARRLDLADRYINNKATKYFLRCGRIEDARRAAALFTRPEARDAEAHLRDMQASWYELEAGAALLRRKDVGPALKKFAAVASHYADFIDDQFDFHTYCIRKMTLRAYVAMLRFEDRIQGHAGFRAAAAGACRLWLQVYDEQEQKATAKRAEEEAKRKRFEDLAKTKGAAVAEAEQAEAEKKSAEDAAAAKARAKREKLKQRKAKAKEAAKNGGDIVVTPNGKSSEETPATPQQEETETTTTKKNQQGPIDDDPDGAKLLASERGPLAEAADLVKKLEEYAESWPDTHALAFDVALRRDKPLLALRALRRLRNSKYAEPRDTARRGAPLKREIPLATFVDKLATFCSDPRYVSRYLEGDKDEDGRSGIVAKVVRHELAALCDSESIDVAVVRTFVDGFANEDPSLPSRTAAVRALHRLGSTDENLVLSARLDDLRTGKPFPVDAFVAALDALTNNVDTFRAIAHQRFPRAPAFLPTTDAAA